MQQGGSSSPDAVTASKVRLTGVVPLVWSVGWTAAGSGLGNVGAGT
jgi:hypothetical protein